MSDSLKRIDRSLLKAMRMSIIALMSTLVLIVFLQILARYLLSVSLTWSEEAARLIFICIIFLGAAVLVRQREHLTVTVFTDFAPVRLQRIAEVLSSAVGLWCSYYLVLGAWSTLLREWDQLTPALRIPMGIIYSPILLAIVLMAIWLLNNLLVSTQRLMGSRTDRDIGQSSEQTNREGPES